MDVVCSCFVISHGNACFGSFAVISHHNPVLYDSAYPINQIQDAHQDLPVAIIDSQDLRERFVRFRVLILGRANAGKTTILQKVCNTMEYPGIYDNKGNKIDAAVVESSIKHGNHDIENEMVFRSNPGFEAGSEEEFENMKKFSSEPILHATKLEERIHAIWYCIPMDEHCRTFQRSEEKFLECDTRHSELATLLSFAMLGLNDQSSVPVVVVFTKFEALRPVAYGDIKMQLKWHLEKNVRRGSWIGCATLKKHARPKSYVHLESILI
ncbi:uncharacterized protein F5891DRAFT_729449 [Suillus fuscotomentosus]|uniref:G domain-containing protein n=1 Tax=Suillus fuscotomentosus TaxID=1912939 RepID=A0AAD4DUS9_9AGAM|nr:uncharacterized protein F5891DRAFT_729449 [Suillus fuscotomentosus]KAG1894321.1 hypothetical protein F5891DRAFT_729449 [Suillus fuscotomentosus]